MLSCEYKFFRIKSHELRHWLEISFSYFYGSKTKPIFQRGELKSSVRTDRRRDLQKWFAKARSSQPRKRLLNINATLIDEWIRRSHESVTILRLVAWIFSARRKIFPDRFREAKTQPPSTTEDPIEEGKTATPARGILWGPVTSDGQVSSVRDGSGHSMHCDVIDLYGTINSLVPLAGRVDRCPWTYHEIGDVYFIKHTARS